MKKFRVVALILAIISAAAIFCLGACGAENEETPKEPIQNGGETSSVVTYEISVDPSSVALAAGEASVCLYSLDGTLVKEKMLAGSSVIFEAERGSYIATMSGVGENISFSSVRLEKETKATIVL